MLDSVAAMFRPVGQSNGWPHSVAIAVCWVAVSGRLVLFMKSASAGFSPERMRTTASAQERPAEVSMRMVRVTIVWAALETALSLDDSYQLRRRTSLFLNRLRPRP